MSVNYKTKWSGLLPTWHSCSWSHQRYNKRICLLLKTLKTLSWLAEDLAKTWFEMYAVTSTGLAPEIAYFNSEGYSEGGLDGGNKTSEYIHDIVLKQADRHNLLRPETVESLFILYRITEDTKYVLTLLSNYYIGYLAKMDHRNQCRNGPPAKMDHSKSAFTGKNGPSNQL